jgi:spoIIIJ-associated protein
MNSEVRKILEEILSRMGFADFSVSIGEDGKRCNVFVNDAPFLQGHRTVEFMNDLDAVLRFICKKQDLPFVFIDVNGYRKEREEIIMKLAKAAARKALAEKTEVSLPPMNAYERMIVHTELSLHPELKTESFGSGSGRHVVIKPFQ